MSHHAADQEQNCTRQGAQVCSTLVGKLNNKTAPAGATNTKPGPNPLQDRAKEGLMDSIPITTDGPDRKDLAHIFLKLIAERHEETRRHRVEYARWALDAGLSYKEIADDYGLSVSAVRMMLKRAGGES